MNSVANTAPTAVAQARPTRALIFEPVEFDGSGSFDDRQPSSELAYAWDLDGNGSFETSGATATMFYASAGTYVATLRVTDAAGLSDTDTVTVTVIASDPATTGGKTHGVGWIPGGGSQHRANFSFEAKSDHNRVSGKITYSYGGNGISLKGGVAALTISGTTAQFSGPCSYSGGACRYVVNVEDNGGDQSVGVDRFTIRVYSPGGTMIHQNSGLLGGGTLHVHPPS
jgi:PKD repeat protein